MKRKKKQEEQQQDNNNNSYDSSVDSTFISSSSLSAMFTDQSSRQELAELVRWLRQSKKRKNWTTHIIKTEEGGGRIGIAVAAGLMLIGFVTMIFGTYYHC